MNSQTNGFSILDIFLKWRKFIYKFVGIGTILSIIGVLFLSNEYITFSTIKGSGGSGFDISKLMQSSGALSSLGSIADIALPSSGGQVDYLVALLNSKAVQDSMINYFNLKKYYDTKKIEDTRDELKTNTVINKNVQAELLSIGVYHENPETAQKMTEYYIFILNKVYTSVNEQSARNNREHLENRYKETLVELSQYEDSLKLFQQNYGVYDIEAQTGAAIKATAELKSQILLKEVEAGVKKKIFGNNSNEIKLLSSELEQLNSKVEEMFDGKKDQSITSVFIPFRKAPLLGLQYVRLYRNVKIYNELIKVIVPMLEQARLQEKRESPSIVIVDKATVPEKKGRPKRSLIVIFIFFGLISLSSIYIFFVEHLNNIKNTEPHRFQQLTFFIQTLQGDIKNIFQKNNS